MMSGVNISDVKPIGSREPASCDKDRLSTISELENLALLTAEIAIGLTTGRNLHDSLQNCTTILVRRLNALFARIWILNETAGVLELQASSGLYTHLDGSHSRVPLGHLKIGMIALEGKPHLTNNVIGDPRINDQEWARREGIVAFAGHPIVFEGRVVGVMALFSRHPLTSASLSALATIADAVANGIAHWRTVDALRASDERFSLAIQATDEGIWDWNICSDQAYLSPRCREHLGYEDPELLFHALTAIQSRLHPDDRDRFMRALIQHLEQRRPFSEVCRLFNPKRGKYHWFQVRGQAMWDATGKATRMLGSICDINQQKLLEDCFRAAHSVSRILTEANGFKEAIRPIIQAICESLGWSVGCYWAVDPQAQVLRCQEFWSSPSVVVPDLAANSRRTVFSQGVGLPGCTWASKRLTWIGDVTTPEDAARTEIISREHLQGAVAFPILRDNVVCGIMEFLSREIQEPNDALLNNLRDIGGNICQYIEIELGKEKALEHERDLIKAKQIEEDSRQKDEFLAVLAHELRNPLSPLSNALQLWPHVENSKTDLEYLRAVMERQVKQLTRLIDDLLDVSRVTRGRIELRRQMVDIRVLLAAAVESVRPLVDAYEHQLTITTPDEAIYVNGDKARLIQVFANILNNAAKYTSPKGILSVTVERQTDHVVVRFRDNGVGIPASMFAQIFELFRQVDKSLDRSHGGLGIGLTLARRLVELHGGKIDVHSEGPGRGSEFVVTLPALIGEPEGHDNSGSNELAGQVAELPCNRILVVDDLKDSADTLAMLLRSLRQHVWVVNDGMTAIEWILANHPDVVFLDIRMPGMDGYKVARRLREYPELKATVLVAFTGYGQPKDRKKAIEAGFDFHLTKPTNARDLQDLLLKMRAARAEEMAR